MLAKCFDRCRCSEAEFIELMVLMRLRAFFIGFPIRSAFMCGKPLEGQGRDEDKGGDQKCGLGECRSAEAKGGGLQGKIRREQGGKVVAMTKREFVEALKGGEGYLVSYGKAVSGWDEVGWNLVEEKLRGGQSKKKKKTGGNTGEKEVERSRGTSSSETEVLGLEKEFASKVGRSQEVGDAMTRLGDEAVEKALEVIA